MRRKTRRTFQPRFFLFLALSVALVVGIVMLSSTAVDYLQERRKQSELDLPVTASASPGEGNETGSEGASSSVTQKRRLSMDATYVVSGTDKDGLESSVRVNNEEKIRDSAPKEMGLSLINKDAYTDLTGVITFGSGPYRDNFAFGTATVTLKSIQITWQTVIGKLGDYAGTSWTGQPLLVKWKPEVLPTLGVNDIYKATEDFIEVIYPSADGNIYFYDLLTGGQSRQPIPVGISMFGTASLDPDGRPMLYVGAGLRKKNARGTQVSYYYAINLITNKVEYEFGGRDYFAYRKEWNAFDASPLIINDTLIQPSEGGVIYFVSLRTKYDPDKGTISITPGDRVKYRYTGPNYNAGDGNGKRWYGFESSPALFRNYLFITDNGGHLQCIDTYTLKLLYAVDLGGDTDASPVLEEDGAAGALFVYTASQTNLQAEGLPQGWGYATLKKINALTGQVVWSKDRISYVGNGSYKSGCRATPHVGRGNISNLLICAFSGAGIPVVDDSGAVSSYTYGGRLVAFDKNDGTVVWSIETDGSADYVSSPLVFYTDRGDAYLIACDRSGKVNLYDAASGGMALCSSLDLGARIDSTPAAFGNYLVVGTTGKTANNEETSPKICCIKIE
jgi:hypothetical protein